MVLHNNIWGSVCDDNWDINDAKVVCRQLGNYEAVSSTCCATYGQSSNDIILDDVSCGGQESRIEDCHHASWMTHNCGGSESAGVVCRGKDFHVGLFKPLSFMFFEDSEWLMRNLRTSE